MRHAKGYTLTEILFSSVILLLILITVAGASLMLKNICHASIVAHTLQRDATIIMGYIIKSAPAENACTGLRSAASYSLPVVSPAGSAIDFVDPDNTARRYYLSGNTIMYASGTIWPSPQALYTAPANTTVTLLFWPASIDGETVGVYVALVQSFSGKPIAGSLKTFVNLRNMPK